MKSRKNTRVSGYQSKANDTPSPPSDKLEYQAPFTIDENKTTKRVEIDEQLGDSRSFEDILWYPSLVLAIGGLFAPFHCLKSSERMWLRIGILLYQGLMVSMHIISSVKCIVIFVAIRNESINDGLTWATVQYNVYEIYGTILFFGEMYLSRRHFPRELQVCQKYQRSYGFLGHFRKPYRLSKQISIGSVLFLLMCCALMTSYCYNIKPLMFPFEDDGRIVTYMVIVGNTVMSFFNSLTMLGYILTYSLIVFAIKRDFLLTKDEMAGVLKGRITNMKENFIAVRDRHRCLCEVATTTSTLIRFVLTLTLCINIVIACMIIYGFTISELSWRELAFQVQSLVLTISLLGVMTHYWGPLTHAANAITEAISDMTLSRVPAEIISLMMGTIVTYAVVVLQFGLSEAPIEACICPNITSSM